jgi:hypothetical protein
MKNGLGILVVCLTALYLVAALIALIVISPS